MPRNLRARIERLERETTPGNSPIFFVLTGEDRQEAEARHEAARAKGERIVTVTIAGIDLAEGI